MKKKHMVLREEDRQLLLHLHDFIYLDKLFVEKYIYNNYDRGTSVYRRLSDLEKAGYIKAHQLHARDKDKRLTKVYTLTTFGVDCVFELRGITHWNNEWTNFPPNWYKHQLLISEAVKAYETKAEAHGLELKEWVTEARAHYGFPLTAASTKKSTAIRPDGIMVVGVPGENLGHALFIEMERSYSSRERTLRKLDQYNEFFSRQTELLPGYKRKVAFDADVSYFKIIFIGGTDAKAAKLLRELAEEKSEIPILITSLARVEEDPFGAIYQDTRNPGPFVTL